MPTPKRSDQVHISGMAARAARLAKEYHCGYEITAFSYAPMLEDAAAFSRVEAECEEIGSLWLHAPFAELIPCAIDPNVRANAMARFRQTTALAARLGVRRIVVHGGFIPYVYFPEWSRRAVDLLLERVFGRRAGRSASRGGKRDGAGSGDAGRDCARRG